MSEIITIEIPDTLARQAREVAAMTRQRTEDVLIAWLEQSVTELSPELLSDDQIMAWCDMQMDPEQQIILDELMIRNREGQLTETESRKLDELMQIYRRGMIRKAKAWKVAVERGLKSPLN